MRWVSDANGMMKLHRQERRRMPTTPSIEVAQNREGSLRMLAAQARLYADVKQDQGRRLLMMTLLGVAVSALTLANTEDDPVGFVGGGVLLFVNSALMYRERRRTDLAITIQETFDCSVFGLEWNDVLVRQRPPGQQIAQAASRYSGSRIHDWYPKTGKVRRPLDILICQQSNVGWGAPVHRAWAWTVVVTATVVSAIVAVVWWAADLSVWGGFDALVAPFLPLAWEAFEMVRHNFESAREKEETQGKILDDWAGVLAGRKVMDEDRCRAYQDEIFGIRRRNARVPDWFDKRLRARNERAMRTTAEDMITEAERAGFAQGDEHDADR